MEEVTFRNITTAGEFEEIKRFASTIKDHVIDEHSLLPIITMHRGDKMFGYFQIYNHPVIVPSWNPDLTTPRDFRDSVEQISGWQRLNSMSQRFPNGTMFIAINSSPAINADTIEKLGFKDIDRHLFQKGGA